MEDISSEIKKAICEDSIKSLIKKYDADATLTYSVSDIPVLISSFAFYENLGKEHSLENICSLSRNRKSKGCLAIEFAGTGLINEETLTILKFIRGEMGNQSGCDWDKGNLLKKSYEEASSLGLKVSLGHTHPVFGTKEKFNKMYGAIPSCINYANKEEVHSWVRDEKISSKIIESKIYKKYGGDFIETLVRAKTYPLISRFSWIASPALNQLGVFEVKRGGKVIYHPWIIKD